MKQNIMDEQLQELSQDQRLRLEQWCTIHSYSLNLSIGQMMQFIEPHFDNLRIYGDGWDIILYNSLTHGKNLCDALWGSVTRILKDKD